MTTSGKPSDKTNAIIDEAITSFDGLIATTSACAVGSFVEVTLLAPCAMIFPSFTITAPNGPPFPDFTLSIGSY